MVARLKLVTNRHWPSFRNVALTIGNSLQPYYESKICDFSSVKPGGKMLCIGTADKITLKSIRRLLPESEIVFYATTEGHVRLDKTDLQTSDRLTIVAVSKFVRDKLQEIGVHVDGVIHHAIDMNDRTVDVDFYRRLRMKFGHRKVILTVSANHLRKGLSKLLRAQKDIERQDPGGPFLIVHSQRDGYYDLQERARTLGLKELWLTNNFGTMTEARLRSLYRLCTIYVQPSYSEGFGLPILEAFRFNKPVVAVHAPPFDEIIKNENTGILFPSNGITWKTSAEADVNLEIHEYSPNDLTNAISNLTSDPELLAKMEHEVDKAKWTWDAKAVYPKFLDYFS